MHPSNPQVAMFGLKTPQDVTFFVEYRAEGWDSGLKQKSIVIHRKNQNRTCCSLQNTERSKCGPD